MRNIGLNTIAICSGLLLCSATQADTISQSSRSTIVSPVFYATFDSGDVTFTLGGGSGLSQCKGFWIRGTDAGYKTIVTAVLTAYQTGATIVVDANISQIWSGSSTSYCLVDAIEY
jgi:hypothetical protein